MSRQNQQYQQDEGDIRPPQMGKIRHLVREQDAQGDEEHSGVHGLLAEEKHQDAKKQQDDRHRDLGSDGYRLLEIVIMRQKPWEYQCQYQESKYADLQPAKSTHRQTDIAEKVNIRLKHMKQVSLQEMDREINEIREQQANERNQMQP